jgi:CRP/FNR family transcriptional regulator
MNKVLAQADIFQGIGSRPRAALAAQLRSERFARAHTVFREGDLADRLYIMVSGKAKIGSKTASARENLIVIMGPADMFGELACGPGG